MYNKSQIFRILDKQSNFNQTLEPYLFKTVDTLDVKGYETFDRLDSPPADELYRDMQEGYVWGKEKIYCWFKAEYKVPAELAGKKLYLYPEFDGYEGLLFVNGVPHTNYASKICVNTHGNHYCKAFTLGADAGEVFKLDLEAYAGHDFEGNHPFAPAAKHSYNLKLGKFRVCVKDELIYKFYYDYKVLQDLHDALPENNFKRAEILKVFLKLHEVLYCDIKNCREEDWREGVRLGIEIMAPVLKKHNSESVPRAGILGHSHMDTAWTWEIDETIKKCARTYANQLNLMDQYPDYLFIQSSALHLKFMEEHYPKLFERIKKRILEGRYEPNGGVWVECDCNITGGEFMVRQFLWGQNYTRKHFGYTSNSFYLPDTFGYSAALPQIMKGCHVDYFLTTKLGWNENNKFPYETYYWQGIDGSKVLVHHNVTHLPPSPSRIIGALDALQQKSVNNERLVTFGYGDGGGGPEDAMLETAERIKDLEGCPKVYYTTVGDFMKNLEANLFEPSTYRGELYLENHRGTLTNQHTIKRNNRKAEIAIHNAELLTVMDAVDKGKTASSENINPLVETLLVNQFHDILPGTCIPEAHDRSIRETTKVITDAEAICVNLMRGNNADSTVTLFNPLSFERKDVIEIPGEHYIEAAGTAQQIVTKNDGKTFLHVCGIKLGAFEGKAFSFTENAENGTSPFKFVGKTLETPFAVVTFDKKGYMSSFIDKRTGRELRGESYSLNTFIFGEEVSAAWDCWNIDIDYEKKMSDCAELLSFEPVSDGAVEFRIRAEYRISDKTTLSQDIVFYSSSPRVDFETTVDWNDKHRLLKTVFDTSVRAEYSVHEIQFGNVKRPTNRNTEVQQARFEVSNHKYTDISEPSYGISILNDCKYGLSVLDSNISLTLHKGGSKPDPRGDKGVHKFTYSFYPHTGTFCAENTVHEAYYLNNPVLSFAGSREMSGIVRIEKENVIAETIKPCEENQKAYIARVYESEGSFVKTGIAFKGAVRVCRTDMLEQNEQEITDFNNVKYSFKPFEISTFKVYY